MDTSTNRKTPDRTTAAIAYLTVIGLIIAIVLNANKRDDFVSFHIRQSVGILFFSIVIMFLTAIPFLGVLIYIFGGLFLLVLWIAGLINALGGKKQPVPVLGYKFEEWLKDINL